MRLLCDAAVWFWALCQLLHLLWAQNLRCLVNFWDDLRQTLKIYIQQIPQKHCQRNFDFCLPSFGDVTWWWFSDSHVTSICVCLPVFFDRLHMIQVAFSNIKRLFHYRPWMKEQPWQGPPCYCLLCNNDKFSYWRWHHCRARELFLSKVCGVVVASTGVSWWPWATIKRRKKGGRPASSCDWGCRRTKTFLSLIHKMGPFRDQRWLIFLSSNYLWCCRAATYLC
jgi:hypothetical protein